ncbi:hypothetical protein GCM10009122_32290 [Fulvivirga kasyanovii]|uniref:YceI family protein n=1 Tax=Fulvivirga kasyanovii TaxID=396812 RepID=A0ABW9RYW3_9BACT|nr:hypothetical protein [Fulvivirga kasyanovii]MTI28398.1 hypothetical protein [Fulvivirga kasyanovii]
MGSSSLVKTTLFLAFVIAMIFSNINLAKAQNQYHTTNGRVMLTVPVGDSVINLHSQKLLVELDYKEANFKMKLPIISLHSGADSLDTIISSLEDQEVTLVGKLYIENSSDSQDKIDTSKHPPMTFEFSAKMSYKQTDLPVTGTGSLEHIKGGSHLKCILGLTFEFKADFLQNKSLENENIKVHIHQLVLDQTL